MLYQLSSNQDLCASLAQNDDVAHLAAVNASPTDGAQKISASRESRALCQSVYMQCPSCEGDDQKACHEHSMHLGCCLLRKSTHLCVTASNMKLPFTLSAATHPSCVQ